MLVALAALATPEPNFPFAHAPPTIEMAAKGTQSTKSIGHYRNQCLAVASANLFFFSQGSAFGFVSPILSLWKSDDTPLTSGPMSSDEVSWVVSIGSFGSLCCALIFHKIVQRFGCKRTMTYCLTILSFIVWMLFTFGRTKYLVMLGRFLSGGVGSGVDAAVLLYVSEVADDRIRGTLGSANGFVRNLGTLTSATVATFGQYEHIGYYFIGLPILISLLLLYLPNTAPHLIRAQKHEEAKKAIRFYKGYSKDSVENKNALNQEYDRLATAAERRAKEPDSITWQKLQQPIVYKGLIMGIVLCFLTQYAGGFTIITYSVLIFQESNTKFDPYVSSLVIISISTIGNLVSTSLVDTVGRKTLMLISLAGSAIGMAIIATYLYLTTEVGYELAELHWIPVFCLGSVVFVSSLGISTLTFLCVIESLPTDVRGFGLAFSIVSINMAIFVSSKVFPILMEALNLYGIMSLHAVVCAFGTVFVAIMLEETNGRNLDEIGVDK